MTIVEAIESFTRTYGYRPTVREVAAMMGQSLSWTHERLARLKEGGIVTWEDGQPRTLRPTRMRSTEREAWLR